MASRHFLVLLSCLWIPTVHAGRRRLGAPAGAKQHGSYQHRKLYSYDDENNDIIPNDYLVRFNDSVLGNGTQTAAAVLLSCCPDVKLLYVYPRTKGIALTNVSLTDLNLILDDSDVLYAEPDQLIFAMNAQTHLDNSTWGLDQMDGVRDGVYRYSNWTGDGVQAYVIDSGIQASHVEFNETSVVCGKNFRSDLGEDCQDDWGHGTHISALIAGRTFGIAKDAELVALKVFGAAGKARFADVIAATEYVIVQKELRPDQPMVANLSLGTSRVAHLLNESVKRVVQAGVAVIVAAGNGNTDACTTSPASALSTISVGALTPENERVESSNWGECVDIYAPGYQIRSAWIGENNTAEASISGTSLAVPFVTAAVTLYLQQNSTMTPEDVKSILTKDAVTKSFVRGGGMSNATVSKASLVQNAGNYTPMLLLSLESLAATAAPTPPTTTSPSDKPTAFLG